MLRGSGRGRKQEEATRCAKPALCVMVLGASAAPALADLGEINDKVDPWDAEWHPSGGSGNAGRAQCWTQEMKEGLPQSQGCLTAWAWR